MYDFIRYNAAVDDCIRVVRESTKIHDAVKADLTKRMLDMKKIDRNAWGLGK